MLTGREKLIIFIPLVAYIFYVINLAFFSARPFLLRWLDGSFGLFVALVGCNIIRKILIDRKRDGEDPPQASPTHGEEKG